MARLLMEDAEWAFSEPFWFQYGDVVVDLPEEFGKWSSVYRQFRRWTLAGLWETTLDVLNDSGQLPDQVQMIDSTINRVHHLATGAKGGLKKKVLAAQKVASRPRSTSLPTLTDCLSGRK